MTSANDATSTVSAVESSDAIGSSANGVSLSRKRMMRASSVARTTPNAATKKRLGRSSSVQHMFDDGEEAQDDSNNNGARDRATFRQPSSQAARPEITRLDGPTQSQAPFSSSQSPRWSSSDLCASIAHSSGSSGSSWRERGLSFLLDGQIDLTTYDWQQFKPQLAAFLQHMIVSPASRDEEAFKASPRYRVLMTGFAKAYLGGEFGSFVDDTLRASPDATARFLARFRDPLIDVVHCILVRPLVYQELCRIVATHDVEPFDSNILAMARRLRGAPVLSWQ